jgi:hypothetical protein
VKFHDILKCTILVFILFASLLVVAGPWCMYWIALSSIAGKPTLASSPASPEEKQLIWRKVNGYGNPEVTALTPHEYLVLPFLGIPDPTNRRAGISLAWQIASNYNHGHLKHKGQAWWHLSGAALIVWLTRNWSTDQLLSKAAEINRYNDKKLSAK